MGASMQLLSMMLWQHSSQFRSFDLCQCWFGSEHLPLLHCHDLLSTLI